MKGSMERPETTGEIRSETAKRPDEDVQRAERIARLKEQVRKGTYQPDVRDLAHLLTSAMNPTL